jgi:hypothetical protein
MQLYTAIAVTALLAVQVVRGKWIVIISREKWSVGVGVTYQVGVCIKWIITVCCSSSLLY